MSAQGKTIDDQSTLPVGPTKAGHVALDESLPSEVDLKNVSVSSDMDIETDVVNSEIYTMCPVDCIPKPSTMAVAGSEPESLVGCKILDIEKLPKLSKWDTLKSKMYLGSAYGGTRMTSTPEPKSDSENFGEGCSKDGGKPKDPIFEALNAAASVSPDQKPSRGSWGKLKAVFGRKSEKEEKEDDEKVADMEGDDAEKIPKRYSFGWLQKVFTNRASGGEKKSEDEDEEDEEQLTVDC